MYELRSSATPKGDRYGYPDNPLPPIRRLRSSATPRGDRYFCIALRVVFGLAVAILGHPEGRPLLDAFGGDPARTFELRSSATPKGDRYAG
ncbi:hypothetical protein [Streptomyces sp. Inha503]|uniref:hypothetical protein n=1 Tax=Streptomyces sp. Inha503 TaxID=3383314 RepID=UPI00399FF6D9